MIFKPSIISNVEVQYMDRCFQLARLGASAVAPNPMVGAVLVFEGRIIGEGWHQCYGEAHAEVNCIKSVQAADHHLISESTLYCTLEPCFHVGKTPPCVDLVLKYRIPKVVISNLDPNPKVAGQSIEKLKAAGVEVVQGVLAEEGLWLNRIFFHAIAYKKPYVILKWAQSADGYIGLMDRTTAISNAVTQRMVHQWRSETGAILVGAKTAVTDNPRLDARLANGKHPLRIAFDGQGLIPKGHYLLDDTIKTWIYGPSRMGDFENTEFKQFSSKISLETVLDQLLEANITSLLVEGGAHVLEQFIRMGLWDEIRLIENPTLTLGQGVKAPSLPETFNVRAVFKIGNDAIKILQPCN